MKKLLPLMLSLLFCSALTAQIVRTDTTVKPKLPRIGYNKLDSQLLAWDRTSWKKVPLALSDTALLDFASTTATAVTDMTKTITGAKVGDEVALGVPNASITATGSFFAWVSAANTVTIRYSPKATENPAAGIFHVTVLKYYNTN